MKRFAFVLLALSAILITAGFGGWHLYQNHLSSDLKRTLIAGVDPNANEADVHVYIRDARLQVRTKKDQTTFDKLVRVMQLAKDASDMRSLEPRV